ncbi:hypothetical protein PGIGA_G00193890 [Pangasianodon gigas]|uniref:Uncharacterized protein n=1 Tax=Pangasianodon gigas TaxID=30993 RepID=A0ACC5WDK4_PANGG|nr:hypothetical protein [Pangasianodon gigas]
MFVSVAEFEISVPTRVQMAVYGESVLLSCTFPVSGSWDAGSSVITWQRHLEVVHSFFHGRDQLQYQSPRYANRTSLFHQEMNKGNASLRLDRTTLEDAGELDRTTLEDAGEYTCSISTQLGSQMKSFGLKVAAFYPEPRLHISMLNDGHVEVRVTSEGGYPSPSLQWLMGNESDITNVTHTQLRQDQHTRLYSVNSKLNLSGTVNSSITFVMKNPDLGQEIRRNIDLFSAFYPEPRLHISMLNDGHVEVRVTSEGGYPSPSLQWLMGKESDITNVTHTQLRQDQHTRLYSVNSKLNLSGTVNSSITFVMKNPDLGQEIRRNINLFSGGFIKTTRPGEFY